jgi:hypothetical protein
MPGNDKRHLLGKLTAGLPAANLGREPFKRHPSPGCQSHVGSKGEEIEPPKLGRNISRNGNLVCSAEGEVSSRG